MDGSAHLASVPTLEYGMSIAMLQLSSPMVSGEANYSK